MSEENRQLSPAEPGGGDPLARLLPLAGPRPEVPLERAQRVKAGVHGRWREVVRARRRRRRALVAAAVVTAGLGGFAWWQAAAPSAAPASHVATVERVLGLPLQESTPRRSVPLVPGRELTAGASLVTGEQGLVALALATGGSLRLDVGTRVRLAGDDRIELTEGGLYLDTPAGGSGMRVQTPLGEVRNIGTRFEVRLDSKGVRVRVRDGRLTLAVPEALAEASIGVELSWSPDGGLARRRVPIHGSDWDWAARIAPPFELEGATLGQLLSWVTRESGREIRFAERELEGMASSVVLHGSAAGLSPEEVLRAALPTCGLEHRLEPDGGYSLWRTQP